MKIAGRFIGATIAGSYIGYTFKDEAQIALYKDLVRTAL